MQTIQDTRAKLFNEYLDCGEDFAQVEFNFQTRLEESQKSSVRYGLRNDVWLKKHHGDVKATKMMDRKRSLGLTLEFIYIYISVIMHFSFPSAPKPQKVSRHQQRLQSPAAKDDPGPRVPRRAG